MQIYLVGGAIRNELLGLPIKERDWVVVGATPKQMKAQGYRQVGRFFPVFLHPKTHEEYALARTEVKKGIGYHGFQFNFETTVTLVEDLKRRDFTMNAIAKDANGQLIDPHNGQKDIEQRLIRHTSAAFVEDPLRVLRACRFAATLADYNFDIAPETNQLLHKVVASGELQAISNERIWLETTKALQSSQPYRYFQLLDSCGALQVVMPIFCQKHWQVYCQKICNLPITIDIKTIVLIASAHLNNREQADTFCRNFAINQKLAKLVQLAITQFSLFCELQQLQQSEQLPSEQFLALMQAIDYKRQPQRAKQALQILNLLLQVHYNKQLQCEQHLDYLQQCYDQLNIKQIVATTPKKSIQKTIQSTLMKMLLKNRNIFY